VPLAQVDLLIPAVAAPACLAAITDPARTVLGPVQKQALKDALQASTASFKVIVNEYPIQQFWALPYDRWEGYAAERTELLGFIRDFVGGQVLFLTTDTHANLINTQVAVDRFAAPLPIAPEVVAGPIATFTFQEELGAFAASLGLPPAFVVGAFHQLLGLAGVQCRNIDRDAYARVDVDAAAGTATIELKDVNGNAVTNANPFDPLNLAPCTLAIP
jgi:phosphodiesterase/alkaline phosphatase D-like protein